jgi:hypothetical protein
MGLFFCDEKAIVQSFLEFELVARERFELSSAAPEAAMFDHCTTGLLNRRLEPQAWDKYFSARQKHTAIFCYFCFFSVSSIQWHS